MGAGDCPAATNAANTADAARAESAGGCTAVPAAGSVLPHPVPPAAGTAWRCTGPDVPAGVGQLPVAAANIGKSVNK